MSVVETLVQAIQGRFRALASGIRIGRFASVGFLGSLVDISVTLTLSNVFHVNPDLSKFAGAELAIVLMFFINEHWTFKTEGAAGLGPITRRFLTSNTVRIGGVAVQLVTYYFVRRLPIRIPVAGFDLYTVVAIAIAIAAGFVVNFLSESLITWRVHKG